MAITDDTSLLPVSARRLIWIGLVCWLALYRLPTLVEFYQYPTGSGDRSFVPDFFQDYASARNVLEGRPAYSDHNVVIRKYLDREDGHLSTFLVNAHPPGSIPIFLPLALMSFLSAFATWGIVSAAAVLIALAIVRRGLGPRAWPGGWIAIGCYLLVCYPIEDQVRMGQTTALILLLLAGAWTALRSEWHRTSGILLGAATCIKLFPGLLLLHLMVTRRWRALVAAVLTIGMLTASTSALLGIETYRDYVGRVVPLVQRFRVLWQNTSMVGFWSKLFDSTPHFQQTASPTESLSQGPRFAAASVIMAVLVMAALAWASWRGRGTREGRDLGFATTVVAALLIGPLTWSHSLLLLLLAFPILWASARSKATKAALVAIAAVLSIKPHFYWAGVTSTGEVVAANPVEILTTFSLPFYALASLFAIGIARTASQQYVASRDERQAPATVGEVVR